MAGGDKGVGVTRHLLSVWQYSAPSAEVVSTFRQDLNVSETIAELLARLGFASSEEAHRFLNPRLAEIRNPFEIPGLEQAVERICEAIDGGQRIVVCGDYDVDGVTSTTLLVAVLRQFGCFPRFIVPLRLEEGYGLSLKAAQRAMEGSEAADLFIALDCGTNSGEEARHILDAGCDLIVIDHHQAKEPLPERVILVNPHVEDAQEGDGLDFCTVGLVFKVSHGILKLRRTLKDERAFEIKLREYLDLVAMGTVADLVPLRGENRIFARIGLQVLSKSKRVGLQSLMKVSGVNASAGVQPMDISFRIGPRINASGRLADAGLAVELLLSDDRVFASETSMQLDSYNRERQDIERAMTDEAIEMVEADQLDKNALLIFGHEWHPGVVGIVASRVSRSYNRPSIVLGREGDLAKGSGRSVNGINLVKALSGYEDQLESYGGHPMAVGVSLKVDKVDEFRAYFEKTVTEMLESDREELSVEIAAWVDIRDVDGRFMDDLARLQPFGMDNPEPVFAARGVNVVGRPRVFKDAHFGFGVEGARGATLRGVAWKMADRIPPREHPIDIAFKVAWNSFGGRKSLQIELVDWSLSGER